MSALTAFDHAVVALNMAANLHTTEETYTLARDLGRSTFDSGASQRSVIQAADSLAKGRLRNAFLEGLQGAIDTATEKDQTAWANLMRPIISHCPR